MRFLFAFLLTALFSLFLTPFSIRVAHRIGAIDVPNDDRRMHSVPIPRLGGLALFSAGFSMLILFGSAYLPRLFFPLSGALLLALLGVADDAESLSPTFKLLWQTIAASLGAFDPGGTLQGFLFSLVTLLFLINAHNFLDGIDGLCGGISAFEGVFLALLGIRLQNPLATAVGSIASGAAVGFLPFNLPTPKSFLGDTGSTLLGYSLALGALDLFAPFAFPQKLLSLFLLFSLPAADMVFAVVRRLLKGKNPLLADRSHLHHLLSDRIGTRLAALLLILISAFFASLLLILIKKGVLP